MERHKATPAAYLILVKDDKILLIRRFNTGWMDGNYSLPSGHLEKGESPIQCLIREAKEEIGIDVKSVDFVHLMYERQHDETGDRVDIFFKATKWSEEAINMEPDKCDEVKWFLLKELPDNIIPKIKAAIESYLDGHYYSELGWQK